MTDIKKIAIKNGWVIDLKAYQNDRNYIWFRDFEKRKKQIGFNILNGQFVVYNQDLNNPIADHESIHLLSESWYVEIMNMFYRVR